MAKTATKEKPILFNSEMVRAILDCCKTQTRRVVKGKWIPIVEEVMRVNGKWAWETFEYSLTTPYGQPGDRLWVRETWAGVSATSDWPGPPYRPYKNWTGPNLKHKNGWESCADWVIYRADGEYQWVDDDGFASEKSQWKPSIHMPRWASRITLEITGLRVQRVQEISEEDALKEGMTNLICPQCHCGDSILYGASTKTRCAMRECGLDYLSAVESFGELWDSIYAKKGYGLNVDPWVWVVEFKVIERR